MERCNYPFCHICRDCGAKVYRRRIGGIDYDNVHLVNPNTPGEAVVDCAVRRMRSVIKLGGNYNGRER